jgi:hypothetical protein
MSTIESLIKNNKNNNPLIQKKNNNILFNYVYQKIKKNYKNSEISYPIITIGNLNTNDLHCKTITYLELFNLFIENNIENIDNHIILDVFNNYKKFKKLFIHNYNNINYISISPFAIIDTKFNIIKNYELNDIELTKIIVIDCNSLEFFKFESNTKF